jgi:uncharacterized membrane protein
VLIARQASVTIKPNAHAMNALNWSHYLFGLAAVLAGALALSSFKGARLHRQSGRAFAITMMMMALSGCVLAWLKPMPIALVAGAFTLYLVLSGWLSIKRAQRPAGAPELGQALLALSLGLISVVAAWPALHGNKEAADFLFFATLALTATALDVRLLLRGGLQRMEGPSRLRRHLWRMGMALFIATGSLFTGPGARVFPPAWRDSGWMSLPELAVLAVTAYYLIKLSWRKPARPRTGALSQR